MTKWITAILLITAAAAVVQQTHNQYEPPNTAGAGQKPLAQFAGEWDVVKTFFPMNGEPIVTKGTCKQYMIQEGKFHGLRPLILIVPGYPRLVWVRAIAFFYAITVSGCRESSSARHVCRIAGR
jgi:hypothetical protein